MTWAREFGWSVLVMGWIVTLGPGFARADSAGALIAGGEHTCLLTPEGVAHCWGSNEFGALLARETASLCGTQRRPASCVRQPVALGEGLGQVVDVAAGSLHTCALNQAGEVHCWGADHLGQVGTSDHSCPLDYIFDPGPAPCQLTPVRSYPR